MRRGHGFTLVELLVVMAIISMLAALLLPALQKAIDSARLVQCVSQQRQIAQALLSYTNDYNSSVPPGYGSNASGVYYTGTAPTNTWCVYNNPAWSSSLDGDFRLGAGHVYETYLEDAHVFYCPDHVLDYPGVYSGACSFDMSYSAVRGFGHYSSRTTATTYLAFVSSYLYPQVDDAVLRAKTATLGSWSGRMLFPKLLRNAEAHNPMLWDYSRYHSAYNYQAHKLTAANVAYWDGAVRSFPRADYVYTVLYGFHTTDAWDLLKEF